MKITDSPLDRRNERTKAASRLRWSLALALALSLSNAGLWADPPESASGTSTNLSKGLEDNDPIAMNSGCYFFSLPLIDLGGPIPLGYSLYYRMDQWSSSELITRFHGSTSYYLEYMVHLGKTCVETYLRNGETPQFTWVPASSSWSLDEASSIRYALKETGSDVHHGWFYLFDPARERLIIFEKMTTFSGSDYGVSRPRYVMDRKGNRLTYTYSASDMYTPDTITDGLGRTLAFTYNDQDDIQGITDQAGRAVTFTYEQNAADYNNQRVLRSVTDPAGGVTTFHYSGTATGSVVAVEKPLGNTPYSQTIGSQNLNGSTYGRVTSQADAYGNTTTFAYSSSQNQVVSTGPGGSATTYAHHANNGPPKSVTDAGGSTFTATATENEQVGSLTDRLGNVTATAYHAASGKLASFTNALGQTTSLTYTARDQSFTNPATKESVTFTCHDLTRIDYDDGTHEAYTRDAHGNLVTFTGRSGGTWSYTRNERGQPLTATNPAGGVTTFTYNPDATLATRADADTGVTAYGYDNLKRVVSVTRPGGDTVHYTYDNVGRPTGVTDERGKTTTFSWDANGNLDTLTNPLGQASTWTQDLMDRVTAETDPLGRTETYTYDARNRLATSVDRNGGVTAYGYDTRDRLTTVTDPGGKAWTTGYDAEGVPTSFTTPLGFSRNFQLDALGRTTVDTDPLGKSVRYTWNVMGQPLTVCDENGKFTVFTYDAGGRLSGASAAGVVSATYARNALGRLTRITDPGGRFWDFGYSAMGRRTSHTDPLGRQWSFSYDPRGRVTRVTRPDAGTADFTYDAAGRVTRSAFTGGPTLDFTWDDAGRLLTANGLQLVYDARGDVTESWDGGLNFGATFDDGRRLKTVGYGGPMTVTYTYDARSLLTRVEDNLSGAWANFTYDDDRRLVAVQRSNGVGSTYTWDAANRVKRIVHGAFVDLAIQRDARGDVTRVTGQAPLDPADAFAAGEEDAFTYDNAAQVSGAGYAYDAQGRRTAAPGDACAWDGAGRLTTTGSAALVYNGVNDLVRRTEGATVTRCYYNHAVPFRPLAAERDGDAGAFRRYYVWSPLGRLLYSVDAATHAATFYHFDHLGSTLALTDGAGAVTDAYAYDPRGRLLAHTGSSTQPFTWVGQLGVRQEGAAGKLYQMRVRYYDAVTGAFLSRDPAWPDVLNPVRLNPYQYADGNPVSNADPLGLSVVDRLKSMYGKIKDLYDKSGAANVADAKDLLDSINDAREAIRKLVQQMQNAGNVEGMDDAIALAQDLLGSLDDLAGAVEGAAAAGQNLVNALNGMKFMQNFQNLQNGLGKLGNALGKIGDFAGKVGTGLAIAKGLVDFGKASFWGYTWAAEGSGAAAAKMQNEDSYKIATILTDDGSADDRTKTMKVMHEQSQSVVFQAVSWVISLFD
ncbi:MAG: RHS repeat protein [Acidobacteria bacterium]|nr:RHS repeat protein [Acidobacteriota bacterium]